MKNLINYIMFVIFLACIIIVNAYIKTNSVEGFTSNVREAYRPYMRKMRVFYDNTYKNISLRVQNLFRKIGFI